MKWKNKRRGNEARGNKERGNKFLRCGAQTPSVRLRGQRIGLRGRSFCSALSPRRWRLGASPHSVGIYSHASFLAFLLALSFCLSLPVHAQTPPIDRAAVYQSALLSYQDEASKPLTVKTVGSQIIGTTKFLRFSYGSTNSQRVPALLFTPAGASASHPVPCLVILHGLGGSKEIMAGMALYAAKAGYASLVIDEYGQGERGPLKTVPGHQAEELATTVSQTAVDVRRGLDYLATQPQINSKRIGLAGVSLGAIIGTVVSGVDTRIKAVVLISGGGDWGLILKTLSSRNATVGGRDTSAFKNVNWASLSVLLAPVDPLTFAAHIAPRPLLMLGGRKDTTIVPKAQQELFDAARQPKQIVWYPQYGHVPPPEVVYPAMQKFFAGAL